MAIELEPRQSGVRQRLADRPLERVPVECAADARRMYGVVRMQVTPAEHCRLEQVEPAGKAPARPRRHGAAVAFRRGCRKHVGTRFGYGSH